MRRGGHAQPVSEQRPARADVECPPVPTGDIETRLVKGERGADTRPPDESRPRRAHRERVDWHRRPRGIWAIDGLRNVTQTDTAVEQTELSDGAGRDANRRDDSRGIDRGGGAKLL